MTDIRNYGLVINGCIQHPTNPLNTGNGIIHNPTSEQLEANGWLPIRYEEAPTVEAGYCIKEVVSSSDIELVVSYEVVEDTDYINQQIAELQARLCETDYKAIKYAEGWYSEEEYAPIKAEREALRESIRSLEKTSLINSLIEDEWV